MPGAYERYSVSSIPPQTGRIILITGSNDGIGYETAKPLALNGAKIYMACRSEEKANNAIQRLKETAKEQGKEVDVHFLQLDLSSLDAVQKSADHFKTLEEKLDVLICNAGIMASPYSLTADGVESQFQVNYLGHWLLFQQLQPLLSRASKDRSTQQPSRVVLLTSTAHQFMRTPVIGITPDFTSLEKVNRSMGPWTLGSFMRYSQAKLSAIYHARQINTLFPPEEIRAAAVHPGLIETELYKNIPIGRAQISKVLAPVPDGALASLYVACSDEVVKEDSWDVYRGTYGLPEKEKKYKGEEKLRKDLWELSERICKERREKQSSSSS